MTNSQFPMSNKFPMTNFQLDIEKLEINWDLVIG
jgi:hypothetical protein